MSQTRGAGIDPHRVLDQGHGCRPSHLSDADRIHRLNETLLDCKLFDRGSGLSRNAAGSRALVEEERRRLATALELEALR